MAQASYELILTFKLAHSSYLCFATRLGNFSQHVMPILLLSASVWDS